MLPLKDEKFVFGDVVMSFMLSKFGTREHAERRCVLVRFGAVGANTCRHVPSMCYTSKSLVAGSHYPKSVINDGSKVSVHPYPWHQTCPVDDADAVSISALCLCGFASSAQV